MKEVLFEGKPDLPRRVKYWTNFDGEALQRVRRRAVSLEASGLPAPLLARARAAAGTDALVLPMAVGRDLLTVVVDPHTLRPVISLPVDLTASGQN